MQPLCHCMANSAASECTRPAGSQRALADTDALPSDATRTQSLEKRSGCRISVSDVPSKEYGRSWNYVQLSGSTRSVDKAKKLLILRLETFPPGPPPTPPVAPKQAAEEAAPKPPEAAPEPAAE